MTRGFNNNFPSSTVARATRSCDLIIGARSERPVPVAGAVEKFEHHLDRLPTKRINT